MAVTAALLAPHLIIFASAVAATVTGYGFVLLASPLLLMLLPPSEAVPLSIALGWVVISVLVTRPAVWAAVERGYVARLAAAGLLGIPLGATLLLTLPPLVLRVALGLVIATLALFSLRASLKTPNQSPVRPEPVEGDGSTSSPRTAVVGAQAQAETGAGSGSGTAAPAGGAGGTSFGWRRILFAGFCGGVASGTAGLGGSVLVLYLSRRDLDKHRLRATSAATVWCTSSATLVVYAGTGQLHGDLLRSLLVLAPALIGGMLAGSLVFRRLPERRFRQVTLTFAALAGAATALTGVLTAAR